MGFRKFRRLIEKFLKIEELEDEVRTNRDRIYYLEQGLIGAQVQLNQLYRILWDYSSIVITSSAEEKNGLIPMGFVVVGHNVHQCFHFTGKEFVTEQQTYYTLKKIQ